MKPPKGRHTKPNVWDDAAALEIWRGGEKLDPGVNYFVLMLDQMELPTTYSCEGHPDGFYVAFKASYGRALEIKQAGFFSVEIEDEGYWSIRRRAPFRDATRERIDAFRWAAQAWEERFGPLDWDAVILST
jgi:hypothetical protein